MNSSMTVTQARDEICRIGKSLFDRGYVHATAGNISVRLSAESGGGYLITPTDACLGFLEPNRLAKLDANGQHQSGDAPSKTIALHRRIYQSNDQAHGKPVTHCVLHTHSRHCVALSLALPLTALDATAPDDWLPPVTPYFVMKVGRVPLIPYTRPGAPQAADMVALAIEQFAARGTPLRAVMLARLGPVVWHSSPAMAMAALEELEETAGLVRGADRALATLTEGQIDELRQTFGALW
jgi:3-dehydro-4-phosphotetronate decarboxylase